MDFQENVFTYVLKNTHLFGAAGAGANKVHFPDFLKTFSWKSKMKPAVKYGVYKDILLRVSIYGTKCRFLKENPKMDPSSTPL